MYMCRWYNRAKLLCERNSSQDGTVIGMIVGWQYSDILLTHRQVMPNHNVPSSKAFGFKVDKESKKYGIDQLISALKVDFNERDEGRIVNRWTPRIPSEVVLRELGAFEYSETGKMEARAGEHDDCVMALSHLLLAHKSLPDPLSEEQLMIQKLGRNHDLTHHLEHGEST